MSPAEDFPELWQQPSAKAILACLAGLEVKPLIWNHKAIGSRHSSGRDSGTASPGQVSRYLSSIFGSSLDWIEDEDQRESIWTEASKRMSERCGRAAMGEITRRWPFQIDGGSTFELVIREPSLTGDCLGFKTWASSYVLALYLPRLASTSLFRLFDDSLGQSRPRVLELGSGTGLLGLAAAALWRVPVCLSDLPEILSNLSANVDTNREVIESSGGSAEVGALTWGGDEVGVDQELFGDKHTFKIVLVADPLYDDNHPALLSTAIGQHLSMSSEARAVVMVPKRDSTTLGLIAAFREAMAGLDGPLLCVEEGQLTGEDDWDLGEESSRVDCWWGIFARGGEGAA